MKNETVMGSLGTTQVTGTPGQPHLNLSVCYLGPESLEEMTSWGYVTLSELEHTCQGKRDRGLQS